MKNVFSLISILILTLSVYGQKDDAKIESIFNGEDLNQWQVPNDNIWWSVEAGVLWAKSDPDQEGSILWTKKEYNDFVVQMDFKFGEGTIDSGIFIRGNDERNPQVQIGISGSLKRDMTGSPYVPKLGYPVEAEGVKEVLKSNDWNSIRVKAVGNRYKVWLNRKEVMNYTLENANLKGPIGIQLHPNRVMTIQFKDIRVVDLE